MTDSSVPLSRVVPYDVTAFKGTNPNRKFMQWIMMDDIVVDGREKQTGTVTKPDFVFAVPVKLPYLPTGSGTTLRLGTSGALKDQIILASSTKASKENIVEMTDSNPNFRDLPLYTYNYPSDPDLQKMGIMADDLVERFGALAGAYSDGNLVMYDDMALLGLLTRAMGLAQKRIDELEARVAALEGKT